MNKDLNEKKLQMAADVIFPKNYKKQRNISFVGMLACAYLSQFSIIFIGISIAFLGAFIDYVWKLHKEADYD